MESYLVTFRLGSCCTLIVCRYQMSRSLTTSLRELYLQKSDNTASSFTVPSSNVLMCVMPVHDQGTLFNSLLNPARTLSLRDGGHET
jgi:hypothetical protein